MWTLCNDGNTTISAPDFSMWGVFNTNSATSVWINSNVYNRGTIIANNSLVINGTYTASYTSVLQVDHLIMLAPARVLVYGNASLAGKLSYSTGDTLTTASQYWVMHADRIIGSFAVLSTTDGSGSKMVIDTSKTNSHDIFLQYEKKSSIIPQPWKWWVWVLIRGGALFALSAIIALVKFFKNHKHRNYNKI